MSAYTISARKMYFSVFLPRCLNLLSNTCFSSTFLVKYTASSSALILLLSVYSSQFSCFFICTFKRSLSPREGLFLWNLQKWQEFAVLLLLLLFVCLFSLLGLIHQQNCFFMYPFIRYLMNDFWF